MKRLVPMAVVVLVAAAAAHGCAKKNAPASTAAPGGDAASYKRADRDAEAAPEAYDGGAEDDALIDDIDTIEQRLAEIEDDLHGQGVRLFSDAEDPVPAKETSCDRVCQLAESICDLEAKICRLAERHEGEQRYVDACERADKHCEVAAKACSACSQ